MKAAAPRFKRQARRIATLIVVVASVATLSLIGAPASASEAARKGNSPDSSIVAAEVDRLILAELQAARVAPVDRASDEDFLRRVCLDLAGRLPTPQEITLFGLDPDSEKRAAKVEELLASEQYAENWTNYWRDVIYTDATNMQARLSQNAFQRWMAERLQQNRPWDEIATELITATGDIQTNGATALIVVRAGEPAEIAAEVSRIFLGVQIQCANCHDHPSDIWKRDNSTSWPRTSHAFRSGRRLPTGEPRCSFLR